MKNKIIINILLIIIFVFSIICFSLLIEPCKENWELYRLELDNEEPLQAYLEYVLGWSIKFTVTVIFSGLIAIASATIFVFVNKKDFDIVKTSFLEKRKAAKSEKAEIAKQKRIEELQEELDKLKKE